MLAIVVAYGHNRVIGADGDLPWHLPTDLKHFKQLTSGHPVIMGRKTYESIPPKFRPLPGRRNLVLTENPDYDPGDGAEIFFSLEDAVAATQGGDAFVIGGSRTYSEALRKDMIDRIYATEVDLSPPGDAFFPSLGHWWTCVESHGPVTEADGSTFTVRVFEPAVPADVPREAYHDATVTGLIVREALGA